MMKNTNLMTRAALTLLVMMLTATTAWAETAYNVSYIDASGNPAKCERSTVVTSDMGGTSESFISDNNWFYVRNSVTLDGAYCPSSGVRNIILGDGATLTINGRFRFLYASVNIYCQSGGTGRLIVNGSSSGEAIFYFPSYKTLTINGGTVEVTNTAYTGYGFGGNLVMNGGTASFTSKEGSRNCAIDGDVTINGGTFTATSGSLAGVCSGTMMIADGKYFIDGSGDIYTGTLNDEQKKALSGKTLTTTTQTEYIQYSLGAGNDGSAAKPYTISNANGWNAFCLALQDNDTYNRFTDKTVKLGSDITVTRMAGSSGHEFCGTFDGDGHTLTVQYGTADAPIEQQQFVAPFVETARNSSPVFRNLTIDGNIYVKYADSSVEPGVGGLIGHLFGNVTVEHCMSNVVINSDKDRVGGFVGLCEYAVTFTDCKSSADITCTGSGGGFVGWSRASEFTIAFEGCLFDGKLLKKDGVGEGNGGFVGWKGNTKTVNINNCLVALDDVKAMATYHSSTFARNNNYPPNITNSYYTTAFGADQGTQPRSIVAGENVTINHIEPTGSSTNYTTSGITAYSGGGIKYDDKFYYGKDDVVSLTLNHEDQEGYAFLAYEAKDSHQNAVILNADGDNYTLTMPDDDVTISAKVEMLYSLTLPDRMEVVSATPAAIGGKYIEGTTIQFKLESEDYVLEGDVMNGDDVLTAGDDGIYTVTVGNADITITATVKKAVEPNVTLSGGDYTAQNGDVLTGSTNGTVTIADGDSITLSDVEINGGIVCEGTATIILVGENSVTGLEYNAGIQVGGSETALTIKGNGALTTTGGKFGAGIGTGYFDDGTATLGDIIIEGGSITANGGEYGAGIGTGSVLIGGSVTLSNITIEGGSITATGGHSSAGIGTGSVAGGSVTLDNITIEGGSITATGGWDGAGIGTGYVYAGGSATLDNITIEGGSITATGGESGAGIGTGYFDDGTATLGDITIKGGTITATGGESGAGIGTGFVYEGSVTFDNITIESGSITATGGESGAGIGTGEVYNGGTVTLSNITIEGGTITATGSGYGAGIGTGEVDGGTAKLSDITIKGGRITANGGEYGAGIGTGYVGYGGTVTLGNITIEGGSITAKGGKYGAGIGTGVVYGGSAILGDITIEGGSITAKGGDYEAGIGTGYVYDGTAKLGTLTIYDDIDLVDATGIRKSGIECNIVYMHGESNVTGSASNYFIITHDNNRDVIKSKKHAITLVNDGQHGTVTVVAKAMSGESVTITVTPDSGYMLDTIEVKDANGNEVSLNDMSFTMPKSDVTITVTWKYVGVKGDVNRDGTIDITDVTLLVNYNLGKAGEGFIIGNADVNGDGTIDITDVTTLVNIILGQ